MQLPGKAWWAGLIYWSVVLASLCSIADVARRLIHEDRNPKGVELRSVKLDAPPLAGKPISGRALLANVTRANIRLTLAGNTHIWLVWGPGVPDHIMADARTQLRPCGTTGELPGGMEMAPGPIWWCFRQSFPLLDSAELEQLRKDPDIRLWFAMFITYGIGEGRERHARLCKVYNFKSDDFERSRRGSCDFYD